ncbi:MAG: Holliday junction branch migration protein RuvA [Patescibacteria group bacterium]|nr:Holliday junction branch migration protein RuvA [Patescibacteria group bacterium]
MIGSLKGIVEILDRPYVIIDVNGVGYRVLTPDGLFAKLSPNEKIHLFTFTYVREDALELFGFSEAADLKLFESLITVSGVGPKTALNIFSIGTKDQITEAIVKGDVSFFTSVPRLGLKNAQKIIIELKSKMGSLNQDFDLSGKDQMENNEVIAALKNFGFSTQEAQKALREIKTRGLRTEDKIRLALKALSR